VLITRRKLFKITILAAPAIIISRAQAQLESCLPAFCGSSSGACAPITPTTFDPTTQHNVALSGGNLTVTNLGGTSSDQGARTISSRSAGKYYYEIIAPSPGGGFREGHGIMPPSGNYIQFSSNGFGGVWLETGTGSTNIFSNTTLVGSTGITGGPIVIEWAVDLDNLLAWVRNPGGLWNGHMGADPLTLAFGVTIPSVPMQPACTFGGFGGSPGRVLTANFGASPFVDTPLTGYTCGWPA